MLSVVPLFVMFHSSFSHPYQTQNPRPKANIVLLSILLSKASIIDYEATKIFNKL